MELELEDVDRPTIHGGASCSYSPHNDVREPTLHHQERVSSLRRCARKSGVAVKLSYPVGISYKCLRDSR